MKKIFISFIVLFSISALFGFSGEIEANTTWSEDIIISGDVWINEGVTLSIDAGVTVYFPKVDQNQDNLGDTDFVINGRVISNGTLENPVIFTSYEDNPAPGDWSGIDFNCTSTTPTVLQHTQIYYAEQGIHVNGKYMNISNSLVAYSSDYGMRVQDSFSGLINITNGLTLFENSTYGIKIEENAIITASGLISSSNDTKGIWIVDNANANFSNSRSVSNGEEGILINNASPSFSNSVINSNDKVAVKISGASSNPSFNDCSVRDNFNYGVMISEGAQAEITYCDIINNDFAGFVITGNSNPVINYCNIYGNAAEQGSAEAYIEDIPTNELYTSYSSSDEYNITFPISHISQIYISGYGDHDSSYDDYYFYVKSGSSILYTYSNPNSYYDTSFSQWVNLDNPLNSFAMYVTLSTSGVSSPWGRVSKIKYAMSDFDQQVILSNSTGEIDAGHNWWGQITGVDDLIFQSTAGTISYETFEVAEVNNAGANLLNMEPTFELTAPASLIINPETYDIAWTDMDIDDNAQISLYYDDGQDFTGTLITEELSEDGAIDFYTWDFAGVAHSIYYIYAVIDDGVNPAYSVYAPGRIMVGPVSAGTPTDLHGASSEEVLVPIQIINSIADYNIISFQFNLTYDFTIMNAVGISTEGTLTEDWTVQYNNDNIGQIVVNAFSVEPLQTDGDFINIIFQVEDDLADYQTSVLDISEFEFNDGVPTVIQNDGLFTVRNEYLISGEVSYYSNEAEIGDVELELTGIESDDTISQASGYYQFPYHIAGDYQLLANYELDLPELVVTPFDASLVARYALGTENFDSNQMVAADVNADDLATVYDAALIAQYSVDILEDFAAGAWSFVPESYSFELAGGNATKDFSAIAIGDPSGNCFAESRVTSDQFVWIVEHSQENNRNIVELKLTNPQPFYSLYTKIGFDQNVLSLDSYDLSNALADFQSIDNIAENYLTIASFGVEAVQTESEIITLTFEVIDPQMDLNDAIESAFLLFDEVEGGSLEFVGVDEDNIIPSKNSLEQNYPNPFNPTTTIKFEIAEEAPVTLEVYNVKGQLVSKLVNEVRQAGTHEVVWDAEDFGSGVYFYKLKSKTYSKTQKMILLK